MSNNRILFLISYFFIFCIKSFSQLNYSTRPYCNGLKYDTITADLVAEVNADVLYYRTDDALIQNKSIFFDRGFTPETVAHVYKSDTIIIPFWGEAFKFYRNKDSCLKLKSIAGFYEIIDHIFASKKNKRNFKRSCFEGLDGATYVRVRATFAFLNYGQSDWLIPELSFESLPDVKNVKACKSVKKKFNATFIVADVIEWKYLPAKRK